ncbi:pollen-specific leucine-rich repeat extensin-like protein 3 [Phoenix dactylifera]|uniref:Pollen-specific leucine-rich repeat extensin-like protein 3 n=1 Tax=Phoenix dactylifera TaxID=42345 RepID=A0A8B7D304_PHODC|nr:pollen-specific leucine-rich repeat extensin-like protein 3 [Phoenix dactylifera]
MPGATEKQAKTPPFQAALHSVQRPPAKPWKKPDHPVPPKVYRVDPRDFRQLVQKLTGAPQSTPRPLKDTARPPPPLLLAPRNPLPPPPPPPPPVFDNRNYFSIESLKPMEQKAVSGYQSPTGLAGLFSPSPYPAWCSFPLLSPGSIAMLEQSSGTVL